MNNIFDEIENALKCDERFFQNGKLLKNKIMECALHLDAKLIELLLKSETTRKLFFTQISDIQVFDKVEFSKYISSRQFLPDSYTKFRNKIGLSVDDGYIAENQNVVLSWPFKDCYLEGGQTKEEQHRREVFLNKTLARDEIDKLLSPKVLTNFRRYSADGWHEVTEVQHTDNLIIKGNNLLVLHSLAQMKHIAGKVKLIYIDPPYNTGNDSFCYNDSFSHSTWLTFMHNRLSVAWSLLSSDGAIFIQTDDNEFAYLKVLCDELFGRDSFREAIVLKSSTESGVNAINVKRGERLFKVKEYILFYSKSTSFRFNPFFTKTDYNKNYRYEVKRCAGGSYTITDLLKDFEQKYKLKNALDKLTTTDKTIVYQQFTEYALDHCENIYSIEKNIKKAGEKFKLFATANKAKGIVEEYENSYGETVLVYDGGSLVPLRERVISDGASKSFGVLASDLWVDIGTTASNEGLVKFGNGKKPEKLLRRIIEMTTQKGDLVLDFHLGSGTTAAVAHKLGRQYIGIEQLDYGENDSIVRLKNVVDGEQTGISAAVGWKGGGSFVTAEVKKVNQIFVDKILKASTIDELLPISEEIGKSNYAAFDFPACRKELEQLDFQTLRKALLDMLDLNMLYLPFTEIDDAQFAISDTDKRINNQLYR
ncbi:MAG: site-specific DNA-methyltransferase [Bacteroidales bacterium]|nr:site-specific DNA-methyltransferase [Bacteroidales bacterium]